MAKVGSLCVGIALTRVEGREEVTQPQHSRDFLPMLWEATPFHCSVLEVTAGTAAAASEASLFLSISLWGGSSGTLPYQEEMIALARLWKPPWRELWVDDKRETFLKDK